MINHRSIKSVLGILCLLAGVSLAMNTEPTRFAQAVQSWDTQAGDLRRQLARVGPSDLDGYLRIGESLGASASSDADRALAMQTLAIGLGLAHRAGESGQASSMCIALASLESDPQMSSSLWDLALMLDPTRQSAWAAFRDRQADEEAQRRRDASRAIASSRFNDPKLASELLDREGIRKLIRDESRKLGFNPTQIDRLLSEMIDLGRDDACRGRVFVAQRDGGEMRRVVCTDHLRPIGASPSDDALRRLITLESSLLGAMVSSQEDQGTWASAAYLRNDGPARDPTVAMVITRYRVDLSTPYWRGDRWGSSP